jgi:sec-independent protein translocase protein TatB
MFDVAWSEMLIVGAVALVVVGPKDLPKVMREAGRWMNRARAMAGQFRLGLDQMMQESELDELRRQASQRIDAPDETHNSRMMPATAPMSPPGDAIEAVEAQPKPKRAPRKKPAVAVAEGQP